MQVPLWTSSAIGALVSASVLVGICVLGGMHKLLSLEVSLWPLAKKLWNGIAGHKWWWHDPKKLSSSVLAQTHRDLSEGSHPACDRPIGACEAVCLPPFHGGSVVRGADRPLLSNTAMRGRHSADLQSRGKRKAFSQQRRQ